MKRWFKVLLICLFALLQSVAPLAHAHTNGDQANHGIHAVELEHAQFGHIDLSEPALSAPDSPSISMPHEFQRENSLNLCTPVYGFSPTIPRASSQLLHALPKTPHSCSTNWAIRYEIPLPHAPPALA